MFSQWMSTSSKSPRTLILEIQRKRLHQSLVTMTMTMTLERFPAPLSRKLFLARLLKGRPHHKSHSRLREENFHLHSGRILPSLLPHLQEAIQSLTTNYELRVMSQVQSNAYICFASSHCINLLYAGSVSAHSSWLLFLSCDITT